MARDPALCDEQAIAEALAQQATGLTKAEWLVIIAIRRIPFGMVQVSVQNGLPTFIRKQTDLKLT